MTISKQPWTTESTTDGVTFIRNALGNRIAQFNDWREAERVIEYVRDTKSIAYLESQVSHGDEMIADLEAKIANLEEQLDKLKKKFKA